MLASSAETRPPSPQRSHPRRRPAHLSVSLRHDEPVSGSRPVDAPAMVKGHLKEGSPSRQPSDDSNDSEECADLWFDQANKCPGKGLGFPRMEDNEPPYFLPHHSSESNDTSISRTRNYLRQAGSQSQGLIPETNSSSVGDYRSVIDDLTIENRKLKQKLRKALKSNNTYMEEDKLFEVRIHGNLPAHRRRELEDILGSFASSIHEHPEGVEHAKKSAAKHSTSSYSSTSRPLDSAYASMSNSGPASATPHHVGLGGRTSHQREGKEQKIQSFLHNIPEGFLPKHPPLMTEKQKKRLVVQRLEQLFTGKKGALVGDHSQPMQQQEVSRSAAKAEQAADDGADHVEGIREAPILPYKMDIDRRNAGTPSVDSINETPAEAYISDASDEISPHDYSPDQRPTRPLDLDPDRAQVPSENVDYIRHLGLSTPKFNSENSSDSATTADSEGWIYLNLLINMAQLHIINVTSDFVREALADVSERFQVSHDGKKVRWRGGTQGTRFDSDSGASSAAHQTPEDSDSLEESNRKRRKIDASKFAPVPIDAPDPGYPAKDPAHAFHYKPLFHHRESSGLISSDESESLSGVSARIDGNLESARVNPEMWTQGNVRSTKEKRDAGLLVYYNGAQFCTDLSGDRGQTLTAMDVPTDDRDGAHGDQTPNSMRTEAPGILRTTSGSLLPFRPFKDYSKGAEIPGIDDSRPRTPKLLEEESDGQLFVEAPVVGAEPPTQPQKFDSCGLGGTRPADHFVVKVQTRRTVADGYDRVKLSKFSSSSPGRRKFAHSIPRSSLESFFRQDTEQSRDDTTSHSRSTSARKQHRVKTQIMTQVTQQLEPSELPPPLSYHAAYSSSDEDSDGSSDSSQDSRPWRSKVLMQRPYIFTTSGELSRIDDDNDETDDFENEDDDGSIDMLAEARRLDPETVALKEQEFEMGTEEAATDVATINDTNDESVYTGVLARRGTLGRSISAMSVIEDD